ncbi:MAG: hypothetical protein ACD_58C00317G0018 [uncultured bacterium]|nr:MAG: hypothetical protein ACD_58C00317G0018 [uncultured bacterium]
MNKTILITRPQHDETTNYLYHWSKQVIQEAEKKNLKVIDLEGVKANLKDFAGRVNKNLPDIIYLNGHGNADSICGHNNEILVGVGNNESLLYNSCVYALACSSAKVLGKSVAKNGTKSFIGYKEDFIFIHENNKSSKPIKDKTARLFFEPSNLVVTTLIKGNTPKEAFGRSQQAFKRNIRHLMASDSPQNDKTSIPWLYWDMTHQVCFDHAN